MNKQEAKEKLEEKFEGKVKKQITVKMDALLDEDDTMREFIDSIENIMYLHENFDDFKPKKCKLFGYNVKGKDEVQAVFIKHEDEIIVMGYGSGEIGL